MSSYSLTLDETITRTGLREGRLKRILSCSLIFPSFVFAGSVSTFVVDSRFYRCSQCIRLHPLFRY